MKYNQVTKSFLLSLFFSVILPGVCLVLFAANTTAGRRDILPELNDPLETIGYIGFMLLTIPAWITLLGSVTVLNYLMQYSMLGMNEVLGLVLVLLSMSSQVLIWFCVVHLFNRNS